MTTQGAGRPTLREQQLKLREDVILREVNALLAEKGYDLMTVDEVAVRVGIAKPSLYKHFESKEALAAAAMVRLLDRTRDAIEAQPAQAPALEKLKGVVRWALREHLNGQMPSLPSTRSALRESLVRHPDYVDRLIDVSERLGAWIEEARRRKSLAPRLPPEAVLYTLYARACDPVADYLKLSGNYTDDEIVELITATCFDGLAARRG
ncbi:MAG TPA: TetR/AcrR family transcriptional regulator [Burkholderiaceae bacterium]|nr:TetR/AcrR family transcriptional regulator [Burkholderiaceae bacterium]